MQMFTVTRMKNLIIIMVGFFHVAKAMDDRPTNDAQPPCRIGHTKQGPFATQRRIRPAKFFQDWWMEMKDGTKKLNKYDVTSDQDYYNVIVTRTINGNPTRHVLKPMASTSEYTLRRNGVLAPRTPRHNAGAPVYVQVDPKPEICGYRMEILRWIPTRSKKKHSYWGLCEIVQNAGSWENHDIGYVRDIRPDVHPYPPMQPAAPTDEDLSQHPVWRHLFEKFIGYDDRKCGLPVGVEPPLCNRAITRNASVDGRRTTEHFHEPVLIHVERAGSSMKSFEQMMEDYYAHKARPSTNAKVIEKPSLATIHPDVVSTSPAPMEVDADSEEPLEQSYVNMKKKRQRVATPISGQSASAAASVKPPKKRRRAERPKKNGKVDFTKFFYP